MPDKVKVEVIWDDAHVTLDSTTLKKARKIKPMRTRSVGYLMAENEHGLVMASDVYEETPKDGAVVNFIPWGMVVEWWEIDA